MHEPGDSNDGIDRSGSEVGAREGGMEERSRSDELREGLFAALAEPGIATPLILGLVTLYVVFAWLIISPVIEAFWPW